MVVAENPVPRAERSADASEQFEVDRGRGALLRAGVPVPLRPKAWEVLLFFVDHPDELLSGDAILDAIWGHVAVTPKTLANVIGELRQALGDDSSNPQYIETVHRRGYRFRGLGSPQPRRDEHPAASASIPLIGRARELDRLDDCWLRALGGQRQMVFLVGEPGIGKTRLIDEFVSRFSAVTAAVSAPDAPLVRRGQCVERHGLHEAYMPLLDAISHVASPSDASVTHDLLAQFAPSWLELLPGLAPLGDTPPPTLPTAGFAPMRMLREGLQFFDVWARKSPLLLILEDLHWADVETIEFLAALVRRSQPARLMIVGSYRGAEARLLHGLLAKFADEACLAGATRLALENFSPGEILVFLEQALGGPADPDLVSIVEDHSDGNPFFVRAVVDHLRDTGHLRFADGAWRCADFAIGTQFPLPDDVRGVIDAQVALLSGDAREVLLAAAAAGEVFDADTVAAGLEAGPDQTEIVVDSLLGASKMIVPSLQARPGDQPGERRFRFAHALYQRVLYERLATTRRKVLHQRIGEFLERRSIPAAPAAVLADHFERSLDHARAAHYLEVCADAAVRRFADRDRLAYLERAETHVRRLPPSGERAAAELRIAMGMAESCSAVFGAHDPRVGEYVRRVVELYPQVDEPRALFSAIHGLWLFAVVKGDYRADSALFDRLEEISRQPGPPELVMVAEFVLGASACFRGFPAIGRRYLESAAARLSELGDEWRPATIPDVGVEIMSTLAWSLWLVGFPDQALARAQSARQRALARTDAVSAMIASTFSFNVRHLRGEFAEARRIAADLQAMGDEYNLESARLAGSLLVAAVQVEELDIDAAFQSILDANARVGEADAGLQQISRTYFIVRIANACGRMGQPEQGLLLLAEADARTEKSGSPVSEAEIWRVRGELAARATPDVLSRLGLLGEADADPQSVAERCVDRALDIARRQEARSLELRAATSLLRLQRAAGHGRDARAALAAVFDTFKEGLDTQDLREAKALLDETIDLSATR